MPPFDIKTLILECRLHDLVEKMRFDLPENQTAFLTWLVTTGRKEYQALSENKAFHAELSAASHHFGLSVLQYLIWQQRSDVQQTYPLPAHYRDFLAWFYSHGVAEYELWPFLNPAERRLALAQSGSEHAAAIQQPKKSPPAPILPWHQREFGVNLIGYVFAQIGLGEDARMTAQALAANHVPVAMIDLFPGENVPCNDRSMAHWVADSGEYAFNLFCLPAVDTGRFYAERGGRQLAGRYNIGYWPWELGQWPKAWEQVLCLVNEVWVATQHIYDALKPVSPVPVHIMPMTVALGEISALGRADFELPEQAKLFCFSFDLNSSIHRKYPQACIDAFLTAFPQNAADSELPPVGLVIKAHKPKKRHPAWEKLKALAAKDRRIHIIEDTLSRPDLLALYRACDCFVSLHRAEGFGRGIAEALQLGLHVITTGYSGNVDFCRPPYADLVRYQLVEVKKGQYPYYENQYWAEPDIAHAAELMLQFAQQTQAPPAADWTHFSAQSAGGHYRARLETIWQNRPKP